MLPILTALEELQHDPAAWWLIRHVEDYHAGVSDTRDTRGWFHASQLGQPDDVLLAQFAGTPGPGVPPILRRVFDNGTARDLDWKRYLDDAGLSVVSEYEGGRACEIPNLRLRGSCDDIVAHPETEARYVFEFKTINPYAFGQLRAPLEAHVMQVHVYMAALGLQDSIVLYESKSNQALLPFYQPFDVQVWTRIVMRVKRLLREAGYREPAMAQ